MFSCKYFENIKKTYFEKHLQTAASVHFKIKRQIQHPTVNYLRCFCKKLLVRCLAVQNTSPEKKLLQGWTIFFLGANFSMGHTKNGWSKPKCSSNWDTTRNISFCSLLPKLDLKLSFYPCFYRKFLQWDFWGLNVALMSKIRCTSKNNFYTWDASVQGCSGEYAENMEFC